MLPLSPVICVCLSLQGFISNWTFFKRGHSTDNFVVAAVYCEHEFGFLQSTIYKHAPPRTILDLGGNTGLVSLYLSTAFPDAQIVVGGWVDRWLA